MGIAGDIEPLWPLAVYAALVVLVTGGLIAISAFLGERHMERDTSQPYESGIMATRPVRTRFDLQFYLTAMFFLVFDLESVFLYSWALVVRRVGWTGLAEMSFFIFVILATLVYLWRDGALDWGPESRRGKSMGPREVINPEEATG